MFDEKLRVFATRALVRHEARVNAKEIVSRYRLFLHPPISPLSLRGDGRDEA